jgi:hypothetical protein
MPGDQSVAGGHRGAWVTVERFWLVGVSLPQTHTEPSIAWGLGFN